MHKWIMGSLLPTWLLAMPVAAFELSGNIELSQRAFVHEAEQAEQHNNYLSASVLPEFYHAWNNDKDSVTFTPFLRWDQHDAERSHGDIRELVWIHVADTWESRIGISKVFWGVTETQHLVDIINQTDSVESFDGEDKLGQPMINFSLVRDWGIVDFFVLPGFRERTFPGPEGRLRTDLVVDTDQALYESGARHKHVDVALRWSQTLGDLEIALSHFSGTSREPEFLLGQKAGRPVLRPFYAQIEQTGLELQWVAGDWLWKLESIYRSGQQQDFAALVGGFEYTYVGILDTNADLGILIEYHYDDRQDNAPTPLQNDTFVGFRITLNDAQSTEWLSGAIVDNDSQAYSLFIEASRRFGNSIKASLEARVFNNTEPTDPLDGFENNDFIQLDIAWYF